MKTCAPRSTRSPVAPTSPLPRDTPTRTRCTAGRRTRRRTTIRPPRTSIEGIHSRGHGEDGEEATHVGDLHGNAYEAPAPLEPVFDDKSNELDIGDVLSDEDASK